MMPVLRDLRHAIRVLAMNRGFTMVAILILAIGIGANIAVFSLVDAWLIRPLPFKDPGRIAIVFGSKPSNPREPLYFDMYRDYLAWKEQSRSFDSLGGMFWRHWVLTGNGDPEEIQGMFVTSGLFDIFGVSPLIGRTFTPTDLKGPPLAVIGFRLWQRRFHASRSVIGKSINL